MLWNQYRSGKRNFVIVFSFGEFTITLCVLKRQPTVALSSCESEFMAATGACMSALWFKNDYLRELMEKLGREKGTNAEGRQRFKMGTSMWKHISGNYKERFLTKALPRTQVRGSMRTNARSSCCRDEATIGDLRRENVEAIIGKNDEAIMNFEKVKQLLLVCVNSSLVRSYLALSKTKEALYVAKEAMKAMPQSAKALKLVGDVYASNSSGRDEAKKFYESALKLEPGYLRAALALAELNVMEGRNYEALNSYFVEEIGVEVFMALKERTRKRRSQSKSSFPLLEQETSGQEPEPHNHFVSLNA
ncbi:anaphase-promoting complex subunit 7 [Tanacetum coccineum]